MFLKYKIAAILLVSALFIFASEASLAQYPGMAAVRANMNRQFMNQQMQMSMQMMSLNSGGTYNPKYTYNVTMADGTVQQITSKMFSDTSKKKTYLLIVDKRFSKSDSAHRFQRIYPVQTKSISRTDDFSSIKMDGIPSDSCWMFKVISGPINAYSLLSVEDDGQNFDPSSIVGIQLNDGAIVKCNPDNLKAMVNQDPKALEFADKKELYRAIKRFNRDTEKAAKKAGGE
jgi:hypothetical protein